MLLEDIQRHLYMLSFKIMEEVKDIENGEHPNRAIPC